jgi:hypothetical protein
MAVTIPSKLRPPRFPPLDWRATVRELHVVDRVLWRLRRWKPSREGCRQLPYSNLGAAIDAALRLRDGAAREIVANITGFRIRNEFHTIIYEFMF